MNEGFKAQIHLNDLPFDAVIQCLQQLGLYLVDSVLVGVPPDLQKALSPKQSATILRCTGGDRPASNMETGDYPISLKNAVTATAFDINQWPGVVAGEVRRRLGMSDENQIPADLWGLIGQCAWLDPEFVYQTAYRIEDAIRHRTLLRHNEFMTMCISPNTIWLLFALTGGHEEPKGTQKIRPRASKEQPVDIQAVNAASKNALNNLAKIGSMLGLGAGEWAGLWDQWLLLESQKALSSGWTGELKEALLSLPLHRSRLPHNDQEAKDSPKVKMNAIRLGRNNWNQQTPQWFREWNRMKG